MGVKFRRAPDCAEFRARRGYGEAPGGKILRALAGCSSVGRALQWLVSAPRLAELTLYFYSRARNRSTASRKPTLWEKVDLLICKE